MKRPRDGYPGAGRISKATDCPKPSAEARVFLAEIDQRQRAAEGVLVRAMSVGDIDLADAATAAARLLWRCQVFMQGVMR